MADSVATLMLRAAAVDFAACKALAAVPDMVDIVIGFHAQQACEKCLKAVLSAAGIEFARTHDLVRLVDLLAANGFSIPADAQWIDELNPYAVDARYGLIEAGNLNRGRTLLTVELMLDWAGRHVAHKTGSP
jgi:hypothetical protein